MTFHFLRPEWLWALIPVMILIIWLFKSTQNKADWRRVIDPKFQSILLSNAKIGSVSHLKTILLSLFWLIIIIALAGPVWKEVKVPTQKNLQGTVIVLDLSLSMLSSDLKPNRLTRVKYKIEDLLKQHPELPVGMVVYSGTAHTITPISQDNDTLKSLLPALNPLIMPIYGSNVIMAMQQANALLKGAKVQQGQIIWITDDIEPNQIKPLKALFAKSTHHLSILAVGTPQGAPISIPDHGFLKDANGEIVMPKLPYARFEQLAKMLNATLTPLTVNDSDLNTLLPPQWMHPPKTESHHTTHPTHFWLEEGIYLFFILLPLAALLSRRGWFFSIAALPLMGILMMGMPNSSYADSSDLDLKFSDAFVTPDRLGYLHYQKKDYARAEAYFESPMWKGVSLYRLGKYQKAAKQFAQIKTPQGYYNLGNALAKLGQFKQALQAYQKALKLKPDFKAAQKNLNIIKKLIQSLKSPKQPKSASKKSSQSQPHSKSKSNANSSTPKNKAPTQSQKAGQNQQTHASQSGQKGHKNKQKGSSGQAKQSQKSQGVQASDTNHSNQKNDTSGEKPSRLGSMKPDAKKSTNAVLPSSISKRALKTPPPKTEQTQAQQAWLNQIPDDPGLFLKRKFEYQYQSLPNQPQTNQKNW